MLFRCIPQPIRQALRKRAIAEHEKQIFKQLGDIVSLVHSTTITKLNRTTAEAMANIGVHARDVVTDLVKMKVDSLEDFAWLS